jgi:hypothetical protein
VTIALWIVIGVVAWCVLAVLTGLVVGRMLARRESECPTPPAGGPSDTARSEIGGPVGDAQRLDGRPG